MWSVSTLPPPKSDTSLYAAGLLSECTKHPATQISFASNHVISSVLFNGFNRIPVFGFISYPLKVLCLIG